jgi:hypothetical protein
MKQTLSTNKNINSLSLLINPRKNNEDMEKNLENKDLENVKKDFEKIGEISDNYQRVIDALNSCIWRTIWEKEIYEKISSEIKNLKEEIEYLEEKKKNLENVWFFKQFRLNRIEKNLIKTNAQLTILQVDLARVTKLSHKLVQFHENKIFVDNILLNIQNNDLNTKISIHEILSSKENTIQYIEKNPNSETHSGKVSTVYSTKDENGNEKFVKLGQIFYTIPDNIIKDNISFNQIEAMGYLNSSVISGEMYYVDSACRQFIENFVADM